MTITVLKGLGCIDIVTSIQHEVLVLLRDTYRDSELEGLHTILDLIV